MSTHWDVYCVTCKKRYGFHDANHRDEFMLSLVDNAEAIAAFPDLDGFEFVEIRTPYGDLDPAWFREHAKHDLVARSEYGEIRRSARDCQETCDTGLEGLCMKGSRDEANTGTEREARARCSSRGELEQC